MNNKSRIIDIVIIIIMAALAVLVFCYANFSLGLGADFTAVFQAWNRSAQLLHSGDFAIWDQQVWGGMTEIGHAYQSLYPVLIILKLILFDSVSGVLSINIIFIFLAIHATIFSVGIYALLRTLKYERLTASVSAVLSVFQCAMFISPWPGFFSALCWSPVLLLLVIKYSYEHTRKAYIFATILGILIATVFFGAGMTVALALLPSGIYLVAIIVNRRKNRKSVMRILGFSALAVVIGIGIAAVQILPTLDFARHALRFVPETGFVPALQGLGFSSFTAHSLSWRDLLELFGTHARGFLSIGLLAYVLAIVGLFHKRKSAILCGARFFFVFILLSSVGFITPYILYHIPFLNSIRELYLYAPFMSMGLAILIAEGTRSLLLSAKRGEWSLRQYYIWPVFVCALAAPWVLRLTRIGLSGTVRLEYILVAVLIIVVLFAHKFTEGGNTKGLLWTTMAMLLFTSAVSYVATYQAMDSSAFNMGETEKRFEEHLESLSQLRELVSDEQVDNMYPYRFMPIGVNMSVEDLEMYGHRDVYTYMHPVYEGAYLIHAYMGITGKRVILQNIRYIICPTDVASLDSYRASGNKYIGKAKTKSSIESPETTACAIFQTDAVGEAWFVDRILTYKSKSGVEDKISNVAAMDFDPRNTAAIRANEVKRVPGLAEIGQYPADGNATLTGMKSNKIVFETSSENPGLLVTADYKRGWTVYVDGEEADGIEVNGIFMGVMLDAGDHTVELRYEPKSFFIGMRITVVTLVICGVIIFLVSIRRSKIAKGKNTREVN
jgi:hypothetical protein